jgi:hypothetical protein
MEVTSSFQTSTLLYRKLIVCILCIKTTEKISINYNINPSNAELNPLCYLLALFEAHHILHVSRIRVEDILNLWRFVFTSVFDEEATNRGWHVGIYLPKFCIYNRPFRPPPFKYETLKMSRMISPFVKNYISLNNISLLQDQNTYSLCLERKWWQEQFNDAVTEKSKFSRTGTM